MALPNSNFNSVRVFPNEYVTNTTVNRGNVRLLQNDAYLYSLFDNFSADVTSGYLLQSAFDEYSAAVDSKLDVAYDNAIAVGGVWTTVRNSSGGWQTAVAGMPKWNSTHATVLANSGSWSPTTTSYIVTGVNLTGDYIPLSGSSDIGGDLIPDAPSAYDLGSPAMPWRDIYVSSGSIHLGGLKLSTDGTSLIVNDTTTTNLASSDNWDSTYATVLANSAGWESVESTVASNSGSWGGGASVIRQYIDAGAMIGCTTSGAVAGTHEYATDKPEIDYFAFDGASIERVQFKTMPPDNWNLGALSAMFHWSSATGSTSGDTVEWGIKGISLRNGDTIAAAFGSPQMVSDTLIASSGTAMQTTPSTPSLTVGGTAASGCLICFETYRNVGGTDDMTEDAWLFGVEIAYGVV